MKKRLIIALTLFVLILSACSTVEGTTPTTSSGSSQANASTQVDCAALHEQQVQLQKAIDAASKQLSSAHGDLHKAEQARHTLIMLHEPSRLLQAQLRACPAAG